jgi:chromosome segregation protein
MRLDNIKLAGFKSFVDPTTVGFPSNLSGVVGPNGCGKSNIIDAVRWVMGESSAKNLRGESIVDVIFNGAGSRSPAGQASIELHFDNSSGRLGGAYQQYNEIVIRRQVNLEGHSTYYLNGSVCRRRDITDIFLGTGLGPRSYAIIEQGTISRLIEAKPQDLRNYLEEAAGISKYKERRRETELRLGHTRDNLARMNDIREELQKQLDHLSKQAEVAGKYQQFKEQEKTLKSQIFALKARIIRSDMTSNKEAILAAENELEKLNTEKQSIVTQKELKQQNRSAQQEELDGVQKTFYEINTELATIEQQMSHHQEQKRNLENNLSQLSQDQTQAQNHLEQENQRHQDILKNIDTLSPQLVQSQQDLEQVKAELQKIEQQHEEALKNWNEHQQHSAVNLQQSQVEQTKMQHLEKNIHDIQQRIVRLSEEQSQYTQLVLSFDSEPAENKLSALQQQLDTEQNSLTEDNRRLSQLRDESKSLHHILDQFKTELQTLKGRFASLQALQEAALGKNNEHQQQWLKQHQLENVSRLAEKIKVESGWEKAVETILSAQLESLCVDEFNEVVNPHSALLNSLNDINFSINLLNTSERTYETEPHTDGLISLSSLCKGPHVLLNLLSNVYVADNITHAFSLLEKVTPQASVITAAGIWLSRDFLRIIKLDEKKGDVLLREKILSEYQTNINNKTDEINKQQQEYDNGLQQIKNIESTLHQKQNNISQLMKEHSELNAQHRIQQTKHLQHEQRKSQLENEIIELKSQQEKEEELLKQSKQLWETSLNKLEEDNTNRELLKTQSDEKRLQLQAVRENHQRQQQLDNALSTQIQILNTQKQSIHELSERLTSQIATYARKIEEISLELENFIPLSEKYQQTLEEKLSQKANLEKNLQEKREVLSQTENEIRELEKALQYCDDERSAQQVSLEQKRIALESITVELKTLKEKCEEIGEQLENLLTTLPDDANLDDAQELLNKISAKIERLGLINLAAISEHAQLLERKNYLDAQHQDLITALELLEEAIRKIDKETRLRFKETYEKVNTLFQELFPQIFGGGQAYLELTGEDLLETGVQVIARPPGKRNSTIHLLSGGEKALTAIALVFSIFQLNPAPFCMLDEVDAPLDDTNIGRFCNLVKEMSKTVQFIFISHNKIAIEMAEHLIGVTMNEPGVSRLVAVDVNSAMEMAEA